MDNDRLPEPGDSLEDLFTDAQLAQAMKNPKQKKVADPSLRNQLDAAAKKMREMYTLPENWEPARGIALIDKHSQTLVGNFREYVHKTFPSTRKLLREHQPINIDATEYCEGYLGEQMDLRFRQSWDLEHFCTADLWFDEMMLGCPKVELKVKTRLGAIVRVELVKETWFASVSGGNVLILPARTDIQACLSVDSRSGVRKAAGL